MEMKNQLDVDPLEHFSKVCDDIRQNMANQVEIKSSEGVLDDGEMNLLRMQGSFSFLTLKQLNRLAQIRCKNIKDSTSEARQKLDGYFLTLQNLQYEIGHLHREITKCLEFRSRHDSIPLVDVEKFYGDAPPEISKLDITKSDEHAQTLARLDWELEQRKRLSAKVGDLEKQKETIQERIQKKKEDFNMLVPCLDNLLKASGPIQDAFNLPLEKSKMEQDLANLLPRPLFVLFLQSKAYQEACDPNIEVSIIGDATAGKKLQQLDDRRSMIVHASSNSQSDDDSESEQEEPDDLDSERARKKHKKSSKKRKIDNELKKDVNSKLHPLQVVICMKDFADSPGSKLELMFSYYVKLGFASVKTKLTVTTPYKNNLMLENDSLLHCMLPGDYGNQSPNPSANHLAPNWSVASNVTISGHPYMWVQQMCGLNFISATQAVGEDMKMSFKHVGNSFSLIRARVVSRLKLTAQLNNFDDNVICCTDTTKPTSLHKWEQITWSDYSKLHRNKTVLELGLCEDSEQGDPLKKHAYFEAHFKRTTPDGGKLAALKVAVAVFPDYPRRLSLLTCRVELGNNIKLSSNDYNLRAIEELVNIQLPKLVSDKNEIISTQLLRLSELFDAMVETSIIDGEMEFPATGKLSLQVQRHGPARLTPFQTQLTQQQ